MTIAGRRWATNIAVGEALAMTGAHKIGLTGLALCTAAAMLFVLALAVSSWAQGPPETGVGTGEIVGLEVLDSRDSGTNRIETRRLTVELEGVLEGTYVQEVRGVVRADGQVRFQGTGEFTGTLQDCGFGTVNLRVDGRGEAGTEPGLPATTAELRVVDQASNTLPATGHGTIQQEGADLTYEVQYVCHAE